MFSGGRVKITEVTQLGLKPPSWEVAELGCRPLIIWLCLLLLAALHRSQKTLAFVIAVQTDSWALPPIQ